MLEVSGNKQKFISTTILNSFWQNNTEKLSKRLFLSLIKSPDFRLLVLNCPRELLLYPLRIEAVAAAAPDEIKPQCDHFTFFS